MRVLGPRILATDPAWLSAVERDLHSELSSLQPHTAAPVEVMLLTWLLGILDEKALYSCGPVLGTYLVASELTIKFSLRYF